MGVVLIFSFSVELLRQEQVRRTAPHLHRGGRHHQRYAGRQGARDPLLERSAAYRRPQQAGGLPPP